MKKIFLIIILFPFISFPNTNYSHKQKEDSINSKTLPSEIMGNWFDVQNNNIWMCGIYEEIIVYKNDVWSIESIKKTGNIYNFTISNNKEFKTIYLKKISDEKFWLGENLENIAANVSKSFNPGEKRNTINRNPNIFEQGTVTYRGIVKGFEPEMDRELLIQIPNVITGKTIEFQTRIKDNGTFDTSFPVQFTTTTNIKNTNFEEKVLFQANTTLFHCIDLTKDSKEFTSLQNKPSERKSLFMGTNASINNELKFLETIDYFDLSYSTSIISKVNITEYKDFCLKNAQNELDSLSKCVETYSISVFVEYIKKMDINFDTARRVIDYEFLHEQARRKLGFEKTEKTIYPSNFFNFVNPEYYNNPNALLTGYTYTHFMRALNTGGPMQQNGYLNYFIHLSILFQKNGIKLDETESNMLHELSKTETNSDFENITNNFKEVWTPFNKKYGTLVQDAKYKAIYDAMASNREKHFTLSDFTRELIYSETLVILSSMKLEYFSASAISEIDQNIKNNNIKEVLLAYNENKKAKIIASEKGIRKLNVFDVSKVDKENLIEEILKQYRGKVVIFDFWATWCAPCLKGIDKSKPFKTQAKYKDIEFVYLTDESSPESLWENVIQSIGGNHYRLDRKSVV